MKVKLLFISIIVFSMMGCSKSSPDEPTVSPTPTKEVLSDFAQRYPTATAPQWKESNYYQKVSFTMDGYPCRSWYNNFTGEWVLAYIGAPIDNIPEAVKSALQNELVNPSDIATVDTLFQRNLSDYYVIRVEGGGIYTFNEEGVREAAVGTSLTTLPNSVLMYLHSTYPTAGIEMAYTANSQIWVNVIDQDILKTLLFQPKVGWIRTSWDIAPDRLPMAVQNTVSTHYGEYEITWSIYRIVSNARYYQLTLTKSGSAGLVLKFSEEGEVILN